MPPKPRRGMLGVTGLGRAIEADTQSAEASATAKANQEEGVVPYRGKGRAPGSNLRTLSVTLPADLVRAADAYVLDRKQDASGYNRSAFIEEAVRNYLAVLAIGDGGSV